MFHGFGTPASDSMPMSRRSASLRRRSPSTASVVTFRNATRRTTTPQRTVTGKSLRPLPRATRSELSNLPSGSAARKSLTVWSDGLSSRQSQANSGLVEWMIIMGGRPEGWGMEWEATMITTQLIPAVLAEWSKNRGKLVFVMQSWGNIASFLGNASRGPNAERLLSRTYVQRNRLLAACGQLNGRHLGRRIGASVA